MIDGNRRWARAAGFEDVNQGHVAGAEHISHLLDWCTEAGVAHVTIWLLSTDNLRRPTNELEPLLHWLHAVLPTLDAAVEPVMAATRLPDVPLDPGVTRPEGAVLLLHTTLTADSETDAARLDHQGGWTGTLERLTTFVATEGAAP